MSKIPFDLEKFKAVAVAVDHDGDDVILSRIDGETYYCFVVDHNFYYPA
jgi:hypothetical protein